MSSRPRALVVEDDEAIRLVAAEALADEGYEVVSAPNGRAGLALATAVRPAVILLDVLMPEAGGEEFAAAYRATPGPHAPIIVFTAARNPAERAAAVGAAAWLAKPFDLDQLLALVRAHVGDAGGTRA